MCLCSPDKARFGMNVHENYCHELSPTHVDAVKMNQAYGSKLNVMGKEGAVCLHYIEIGSYPLSPGCMCSASDQAGWLVHCDSHQAFPLIWECQIRKLPAVVVAEKAGNQNNSCLFNFCVPKRKTKKQCSTDNEP